MEEKFKKNSLIGDRIRELRENKKLTRPKLAEKLGVSLSALQNWETNQTEPQATKIIDLANMLDTSTNYLLHGSLFDEQSLFSSSKSDITQLDSDEDLLLIDDCRKVKISAGFGSENNYHIDIPKVRVEKAWLKARDLKAKHCAMFSVSGDTMDPTLKDGEEIIVDRSKQELKDGKIFVINRQGEMLVKKVQLTLNGVKLLSDNSFYEPIELDATDAEHLRIVGQVVRGYKNF